MYLYKWSLTIGGPFELLVVIVVVSFFYQLSDMWAFPGRQE